MCGGRHGAKQKWARWRGIRGRARPSRHAARRLRGEGLGGGGNLRREAGAGAWGFSRSPRRRPARPPRSGAARGPGGRTGSMRAAILKRGQARGAGPPKSAGDPRRRPSGSEDFGANRAGGVGRAKSSAKFAREASGARNRAQSCPREKCAQFRVAGARGQKFWSTKILARGHLQKFCSIEILAKFLYAKILPVVKISQYRNFGQNFQIRKFWHASSLRAEDAGRPRPAAPDVESCAHGGEDTSAPATPPPPRRAARLPELPGGGAARRPIAPAAPRRGGRESGAQ